MHTTSLCKGRLKEHNSVQNWVCILQVYYKHPGPLFGKIACKLEFFNGSKRCAFSPQYGRGSCELLAP